MSLKSKLKKRKPEHIDLVFCLDRPLLKELESARLADARDQEGRLVSGKSARVKELEKQIADASVTIRITGMPWGEYNELQSAHPPVEGSGTAFNPETFFAAAAKATAEEVTGKSTVPVPDEDWDEFVEGLTDGEFERLAGAVMQVNRNVGTVSTAPLG